MQGSGISHIMLLVLVVCRGRNDLEVDDSNIPIIVMLLVRPAYLFLSKPPECHESLVEPASTKKKHTIKPGNNRQCIK